MSAFVLHLQSATQYEHIENVTSFVGEDASGGFGILPGHARLMTVLEFGLARFRVGQGNWEFLALPGGLVYFTQDQLFLNTRRYLRSGDYESIQIALQQQFAAEEGELRAMKESLQRLEQEMLKRLLEINRGKPA
jgi:F-type H+-transporting ATPase subunit epsilon